MKKKLKIPMQFFAKEEKPEEKASETEEEKKSEAPAEEKPAEAKKEDLAKEEKASDDKQADENGEGADAPPAEEKFEEEKAPEAPKLSETDELRVENLRLKTQLEAMKIGFNPDCLEDAVVLAENIVKRDGTDITAALQAVAKKYPDWKSDSKDSKSKGGFKVGADSPKDKAADDEQLNSAFGIRKKK